MVKFVQKLEFQDVFPPAAPADAPKAEAAKPAETAATPPSRPRLKKPSPPKRPPSRKRRNRPRSRNLLSRPSQLSSPSRQIPRASRCSPRPTRRKRIRPRKRRSLLNRPSPPDAPKAEFATGIVEQMGTGSLKHLWDQLSGWIGTLAVAVIAGLVCVLFGSGCQAPTPLLWALACFASGFLLGFLFGIPRIVQPAGNDSNDAAGKRYRQIVNKNLEEISDWLTKIIVGLGLIELKDMPVHLDAMASELAASLEPQSSGHALSSALIVYFVIIGFLAGFLVTRLLIAGELAKADTRNIDLAATDAKVTSLETDIEQLKSRAFLQDQHKSPATIGAGATDTATEGEKQSIPQELTDMAATYLAISDPDWRKRVQLKDEVAREMASYVIDHHVSKDALASQHNEGLALALASAVHAFPEAGDVERLLRIADEVTRLHVKYRIVLAFGRLFERRIATADDRNRVENVLSLYLKTADAPLRAQIEETRAVIEVALRGASLTKSPSGNE